ncbi:hypothetical protein ABB37_01878 [Leptomonas pyrrhocoris]|uniref:PH-like domain-containing protein n=1 Tax=Leptomonas pyrrhocoris TaxID=157538 RepID=A0A0M9G6R6_LEPPY|nr:hypothetical protein ABB37_01878 [Leptomonas pyrrhocoris]KPA83597.1 hypothetical protein ABB37_01878 [Leptomonas pyrrhocoris]|eukprot:XP_015662036.1 hypothetical protein ABB37_01878 [Leptomonas pyrrhocoris]
MAPRTGPRVKVVSPNSGTVTTLSRSISTSSAYGSARVSPTTSPSSFSSTGRQQRHYGGGQRRPDEAEVKPPLQRYTAAAAAASVTPPPPPPQAGGRVLRAMGINTTAAPSLSMSKKSRDAPANRTSPPLPSSYPSAAPDRSLHNSSGGGGSGIFPQHAVDRVDHRTRKRSEGDLPNYFAEVERRHASYAPPSSRPRPPQPPSFATATSTQERTPPPPPPQTRRRRDAAEEVENMEAIRRARAALERAGDGVLRRPAHNSSSDASGSGGHLNTSSTSTLNASSNKSASSLMGGSVSSLPRRRPASASPGAPAQSSASRRGLRLPPSIPITCAASEGDADTDTEGRSEASVCSNGSSRKRARSWAKEGIENAAALARRRNRAAAAAAAAAATTSQNVSSLSSSYYTTDLSVKKESADAVSSSAERRVCPGMFSGVSALPLDPQLFAGAEHNTGADAASLSASQMSRADTASGEHHRSNARQPQQRYCVQPRWSLVGTFKTSLSGLVAVDVHHDCLRWSQRNPKGGQQSIKVPLSHVLDVFTTRVVQEDEHVAEKSFTVVVRTSTRPSQVVFGFATATEANHLRSLLRRH